MRKMTKGAAFAVALLFAAAHAEAATQHILGKKLQIKDPNGSETSRLTLILGKEPASGTGCADTIVGNPVASGGSLQVIANGTTGQNQTFPLASGSWSVIPGGFKFRDTANSQPAHLVKIFKTGSGICKFKALLKGADGGSLNLKPPNTGTDGGAILTLTGGDTYCIHFGGADGGTIVLNDNKTFKVLSPTGEAVCPAVAASTTSTSTSTSSSTSRSTSTSSSTSSSTSTIISTTTSTTTVSCCANARITLTSSSGTLRVDNLAPFTFPPGVITTMDMGTVTGTPTDCKHPAHIPAGGFFVPHFDIPALNYCSQVINLGCESGAGEGQGFLWDGNGTSGVALTNVLKLGDTSDGSCDTTFTGANCTTSPGGAGANTLGDIDETLSASPGGGVRSVLDIRARSRTWSDSVCAPAVTPGCCVTANYGDDTSANGELLITLFDFVLSPTTGTSTAQFADKNSDGCKRAGSGFFTPGVDGPKSATGTPAAGPCCSAGQATTVVTIGMGFSGGAPLFDLGFVNTIPNTVSSCGAFVAGSCTVTTDPCLQ